MGQKCGDCGLQFKSPHAKCEHRRKKRVMDFYCCADSEFRFVDGDPKSINPKQYEDYDHSLMGIFNYLNVCLGAGSLKSIGKK